MNHGPGRIGFPAATLTLVSVFATSSSPIPLYNLYRAENGLSSADLSLTAVGYFMGAITALLFLGRISNHIGRKPIAFISLALAMSACGILMSVEGPSQLILARILQGLACGLASGGVTAYIVDAAPTKPAWLGTVVTSGAPMLGLTIGALGAGGLVDLGISPRHSPFESGMIILLACVILIAFSEETAIRKPGAIASIRPVFVLPGKARALFPVACLTFVPTWALGGFYQAYAPSLSAQYLGVTGALVSAAVFASLMAPSPLGATMAGRLSPANAQRIGISLFAAAVGGVLIALKLGSALTLICLSAIAGVAQGMTLAGSIGQLLAEAEPAQRAGIFSAVYATCYAGAAIPALIAGQLSRFFDTFQLAAGYGVLAIVCAALVIGATGSIRRNV